MCRGQRPLLYVRSPLRHEPVRHSGEPIQRSDYNATEYCPKAKAEDELERGHFLCGPSRFRPLPKGDDKPAESCEGEGYLSNAQENPSPEMGVIEPP